MFIRWSFIVLLCSSLYADYWSTPATPVPSLDEVFIFGDLIPCYNKDTQKLFVIATYSELGLYNVIATAYNRDGTWDPYFRIPSSDGTSFSYPYCCYDNGIKKVLVTAGDGSSNFIYFSTFSNSTNATTFTRINDIFTTYQYTAYPSYDSNSKQIVTTWNALIDGANPYPFYTTYNNSTWSNTSTTLLSSGTRSSPSFSCYNSGLNNTFITWVDYPTGHPYYAVVNQQGVVKTGTPITTTQAIDDSSVFCCYNTSTKEVFATWINGTGDNTPYCAIYSNSTQTWSEPIQIHSEDALRTTRNLTVPSCYNEDAEIVFMSWVNNDGSLYYSIYNSKDKTFSSASKIPGSTPPPAPGMAESTSNPFCCYDNSRNEIVILWAYSRTDPFYATYHTTPISSPLPCLINQYSPVKRQFGL
jgi:hypothetical protein